MPPNENSLLAVERQRLILDILQREGVVRTAELQELLNVSVVTVRADLRELETNGALEIVRGGAVSKRPPTEPEQLIGERSHLHTRQKRHIGAHAAQLVQAGQTIIVDAGTTTVELIKHLPTDLDYLRVVTASLNVATAAANLSGVELIVTGGTLRRATYALFGSQVLRALENINADWSFLACNGFSIEYGVTTSNLLEAEVKQLIVEHGAQIVLLSDSSKFGKKQFARVIPLDKVDTLITDTGLSDTDAQSIRAIGVDVLCV